MNEVIIIKSDINYLETVKELLKISKLPYEDINDHFDNFYAAILNGEVAGVIGLEIYSEIALLRSFAVKNNFQNRGIGKKLLNKIFEISKGLKIEYLYLLTTTAQGYFSKYDFLVIDKNLLPEAIKNTREFQSICPKSAVSMYRKLL
jgi:amino-acid N-acetyltransferase